jgi:hypothetical protein
MENQDFNEKKNYTSAVLDKVNDIDDLDLPGFMDGVNTPEAGGEEVNDDNVEVIVRKVIKDGDEGGSTTTETIDDDETIEEGLVIKAEGDAPAIGDEVVLDGEAVEVGSYEYTNDDGEVVAFQVEDGVIASIGDKTVTVVRGGKKVKKTIRAVKKKMSAKQKAALKKAQKKAHTGSAKRKRAKSMKIAASTETPEANADNQQTDGIDIEKVDEALVVAVVGSLKNTYEISDDHIDFLCDELPEDVLACSIKDGKLTVNVPVWIERNDEIDVKNFDTQEYEIELDGEFDTETLAEKLKGEGGILESIVI